MAINLSNTEKAKLATLVVLWAIFFGSIVAPGIVFALLVVFSFLVIIH